MRKNVLCLIFPFLANFFSSLTCPRGCHILEVRHSSAITHKIVEINSWVPVVRCIFQSSRVYPRKYALFIAITLDKRFICYFLFVTGTWDWSVISPIYLGSPNDKLLIHFTWWCNSQIRRVWEWIYCLSSHIFSNPLHYYVILGNSQVW